MIWSLLENYSGSCWFKKYARVPEMFWPNFILIFWEKNKNQISQFFYKSCQKVQSFTVTVKLIPVIFSDYYYKQTWFTWLFNWILIENQHCFTWNLSLKLSFITVLLILFKFWAQNIAKLRNLSLAVKFT